MLTPSLVAAALVLSAPPTLAPEESWQSWPARRFVTAAAPCLRPADLAERLRALEALHAGRVHLEQVGRSVEGRPIELLSLGRGPRRILLWSQMHGDEPSATPALLDVVHTLLGGGPEAERVLDRLTLLIVPMLNPDGAQRYGRRNAQGIDVNRDALQVATPEGRILKALRDRFEPELGFNLHDQDRRTTVGDTGVLSTISLLAVAGDPQGTLTPGRARARRVCSLLARTLGAFVPGGIARYDEDWNPRAFGDNLTAWGTPVVLVESGGLPPGRPLGDLTRLDYVGLLAVLRGLAEDDLRGEDPAVYEGLKRNSQGGFADVLLAGGRIAQPTAKEPYRADLAFDLLDPDAVLAGCGAGPAPSRIVEVGDGRLLAAGRRIDASGRLVVPALAAEVDGLAAGEWLDASAMAALARLGVARLVWRVLPAERAAALAAAARLSRPGRPSIEVVSDRSSLLLDVGRRPAEPKGRSLADALDALTHGSWRAAGNGRTLPDLITGLSAPEPAEGSLPVLAPDRPASLVVLRPRAEGTLDPAALDVEAVLIDGREPAGDEPPRTETR